MTAFVNRARRAARRGLLCCRARALSGALAAAAALAGVSCGFPSPQACELRCGAEGTCPDGFECQAQTLLCVPRGALQLCEASLVDPNQPSAGVPASGGAGGGLAGTAGGTGEGGAGVAPAVSDAGSGGGFAAPGAAGQPPGDTGSGPAELRICSPAPATRSPGSIWRRAPPPSACSAPARCSTRAAAKIS